MYDAENVQGRVWTSVSEVTSSKAALDKACKNLKATAKWLKKDVFDPICAARGSAEIPPEPAAVTPQRSQIYATAKRGVLRVAAKEFDEPCQ